jgi:hypothetical protein
MPCSTHLVSTGSFSVLRVAWLSDGMRNPSHEFATDGSRESRAKGLRVMSRIGRSPLGIRSAPENVKRDIKCDFNYMSSDG